MNENWCDWHVLFVEGTDTDDRQVTVMHPDCGFTFTTGEDYHWHCAIQGEIDNVGFETLLGDQPGDGWFRARMQHYTIRGSDWSEIDTDYEVERLVVAT